MRVLFLMITLFLWFVPGTSVVYSAQTGAVIIDYSKTAYTVFMHIPREKVEEVTSRITGKEGMVLVDWSNFLQDSKRYVASRILLNEYKGSRVVDGIVSLLEKYPNVPFGLTWNGGVAFTRNDYEYAKKTYAKYRKDPDEYQRTKNRDPRADPVKPEWHFGPLLGW